MKDLEARKLLLAYCLKYDNDWNRVYQAVSSREDLSDEDVARADNFTGNYISIIEMDYPRRVKEVCAKPPFVLYYEGDVSLLKLVDKYNSCNELIFLHGPNTFDIPNDVLCTITDDNKISIANNLKVWFNKSPMNVSRYFLAAALCNNIVCTKEYPLDTRSWFAGITVHFALDHGGNVLVKPTSSPSYNNKLIKDGAFLIDSHTDLYICREHGRS